MEKWKAYGRNHADLRRWADLIGDNPELRMGYCMCVIRSAADEMERMESKIIRLTTLLEATRSYRIGHEVPMDWFIKRDREIGTLGVVVQS